MNNSLDSKWNEVCERVSSYENVDASQFNALMERVMPQVMGDGFLLVTTANSFLKKWLEQKFVPIINRALIDIYGKSFSIVVEIDDTISESNAQNGNTPASNTENPVPEIQVDTQKPPVPLNPQNPASNTLVENEKNPAPSIVSENFMVEDDPTPITNPNVTPDYLDEYSIPPLNDSQPISPLIQKSTAFSSLTFENFVIGESNRMAYSMAVQVAESPGASSLNPLFIYGKSGLGKTHLMRAIQNYINETEPDLTTIYADSEEIISGYTDAAAENNREKLSYKNFKNHYESADILLIDDIQFLQGKPGTLDIVFQIFNKLINQGKQIILSADRAPKNIDIEERYSSRFVQGGTIDIQPPEVETKLAIVKSFINEYRQKEGNFSLNVPEEVQMYIAENSGSNIRELKGAITILVYHINFSGQQTITIQEVTKLLENHFSKGLARNISIDDIQHEVESFYRIKHADMIGSSRSHEVVFPRQVAIYLCRQLLDLPFNDIGKKFNRDHTTAMHSVAKVEKMLLIDRNVQEEMETLKKIINDL